MANREKEEIWEWGNKEGGTKDLPSPWNSETQAYAFQTSHLLANYLSPLQKTR